MSGLFDLIIRNGRIMDGTGNPWFRGDIGIWKGRIEAVARDLDDAEAAEVIDARDMIVAPGFIDVHTHTDRTILTNNRAESSIHAGVTTEGIGQCGGSVYPAIPEDKGGRTWGSRGFDFVDLAGFREECHVRGIGINLVPYVGHGTLRTIAMGPEGEGGERVVPTEDELEVMKRHLRTAMEQGAFALSTGLIYAPGRNALTREIVELGKVVAEYGGFYISHVRSESEYLIEAVHELIAIAEQTGLPSTLTHHKAMYPRNWGKPAETLRLVDEARARGLEIYIDQYPWEFPAQSTLAGSFAVGIEGWQWGDPVDQVYELLKSDEGWAELKAGILRYYERERERYETRRRELEPYGLTADEPRATPDARWITGSPNHPELNGKHLGHVATYFGMDDYLDAARLLFLEDEGQTMASSGGMSMADIERILAHPHTAVSTDSWTKDGAPEKKPSAHPRDFGTFARVLGEFTREKGVLSLEEAVRKMTSLPAAILGLSDRGVIKRGAWADITIFDPNTVANRASFTEPWHYPVGIEYVIVNGEVALRDGKRTDALAGRVLSRWK